MRRHDSIRAETLEVRDRSAGAGPLLVDINAEWSRSSNDTERGSCMVCDMRSVRRRRGELALGYLYLVYILSMLLQVGSP
jgi:hypothetical protein